MEINRTDWLEADRLNDQGRERANAGDWEAALSLYRQATDRVPAYEPAWFNMALIHKQHRQWDQALECNERAAALGGEEGDPAWWNLGIAATALRRWDAARNAWRRFGIEIPDGPGELQLDFGIAPVRLDPDGHAEVVWGRRVDPARVVIMNVPTPASGHRWATWYSTTAPRTGSARPAATSTASSTSSNAGSRHPSRPWKSRSP
ncbi:MAG TPA: tetratricopeptide repeat protein [Streptosporangiaceae bacterium]|nr:tetratricopeptide repeat protein [Streptosporangiaceae bacterium]